MLDRVEIRNFRAQVKCDIDFDPSITTIIGSNYTGKSTIIRALVWAMKNSPPGDCVINWDADKAIVRLFLDEKYKILRRRGKGINKYKLNKKPFTAFGRGNVPEAISDILNISDVNIQNQHDAPFWFCLTPPEVSRQLNQIINLKSIDTTLSNLDSDIRKTNSIISVTEDRVNKAKQEKEELSYIKAMNSDFTHIETLDKQIREKARGSSVLSELLKSGLSYRIDRNNSLKRSLCAKIACIKGKELWDIRGYIKNLEYLLSIGQAAQECIDNIYPSYDHIEKIHKKSKQAKKSAHNLYELIAEIRSKEMVKCQLRKKAKRKKQKLEKMTKDRCPLCGEMKK